MTKIPSVEAFWKMLEATQFVKTTNNITDKVEEHPPAIQDMEAIIAIHGEFDKYAIDDWLTQALQAQRDAGAREERERITENLSQLRQITVNGEVFISAESIKGEISNWIENKIV